MAYGTQQDLDDAIGHDVVLLLFDDDGDGTADPSPLAAIFRRAGSWVDSFMSVSYGNTWPTTVDATTGGYAEILREAWLYKAIEFAYLRKPGFIRNLGEDGLPAYERMAKELLTNLVGGKQRVVEATPAKGDNVSGGLVYDHGPRMTIDATDGTTNGGDL